MLPPIRARSRAKWRSSASADRQRDRNSRSRVSVSRTRRRSMTFRTGRCLCGVIHYQIRGEPMRVGLRHCAVCREESGAVFTTFAVWPREAFSSTGDAGVYEGRGFCPACGSRLFNLTVTEAEIRIGSQDATPTDLKPSYEVWTNRREPWPAPLPGCQQFDPAIRRRSTAVIWIRTRLNSPTARVPKKHLLNCPSPVDIRPP